MGHLRMLVLLAVIAGAVHLYAATDGNRGFQGELTGSHLNEHVAGVPSGGAPWVISNSEFNVTNKGRIEIEVRGLLISSGPAVNTTGPVRAVKASLVCGDVVAASTNVVPLTPAGDFAIHDTITVPARCIAPAILIRIAETTSGPVANGPFIAVNALTGAAAPVDDEEK